MKRSTIVINGILLMVSMLLSCSSDQPSNDAGNSLARGYQVEIIELTEPVYETIRTEKIDQPNCQGTATVENVVERSRGINHSIVLGAGLEVDVDGKLEVFGTGVDLGVLISNELGYQYGQTESITRSIIVGAAPNTHMSHTIKQSEIWEVGTARVTSNGQSTDIPFRFRANFSVDLLESAPIDCVTGQVSVDQPVAQPANQQALIDTLCPVAIAQDVMDSWKIGIADVQTVQAYIEEFDKDRYGAGAFHAGARIPAGVVVATNFDEVDANAWSQYPVIEIVRSGSWGLFQTVGEFTAPNAGACRQITR
jgi:hypothetical protein